MGQCPCKRLVVLAEVRRLGMLRQSEGRRISPPKLDGVTKCSKANSCFFATFAQKMLCFGLGFQRSINAAGPLGGSERVREILFGLGVTNCSQGTRRVYLARPDPPTNTDVLRSVAAAAVTMGCCERPSEAVEVLLARLPHDRNRLGTLRHPLNISMLAASTGGMQTFAAQCTSGGNAAAKTVQTLETCRLEKQCSFSFGLLQL
jgi:hypothetical protein